MKGPPPSLNCPPALDEAARAAGYESFWTLARTFPREPLVDIAARLSPRTSAVRLSRALVPAAESGWLDVLAKDFLCRELNEALPRGWGHGDEDDDASDAARSCQAAAFARWAGALGVSGTEYLMAVWNAFQSADIPDEWLPADIDDPILCKILDAHSLQAWREAKNPGPR